MYVISGPDGIFKNVIDKNEVDRLFKLFHDYHYVEQIMEGDRKAYVELCKRMFLKKDFKCLVRQYKLLSSFYCILTTEHRCVLLRMFDAVRSFHDEIQTSLEMYLFNAHINDEVNEEMLLLMCLELGEFFIQSALFDNAVAFLKFAEYLSNIVDKVELKLEILNKFLYLDAFLHQYNINSQLTLAHHTVVSKTDFKIKKLLSNLKEPVDLAAINSNYSLLYFTMGRYDLAYQYALSAVKCLTATTDLDVVVQIFCQAAKAFLVNQFCLKGKYFMDCAVGLAVRIYCCPFSNPKIAKVFADYGFFLRKVEKYKDSKEGYRAALNIYGNIFRLKNMYIGSIEKDLVECETEGEIYIGDSLKFLEYASKMVKYAPPKYADSNKMMLINIDLAQALLLIKLYNKTNPCDINTRKLHHIQILLKRSERIIMKYCGVTSSLYTKYLIVLTNVYFAIGKNKYAFEKSKSILEKNQYFSINRNLHEALAKAEIACTIIHWCKVEDYLNEVIEATLTLESSVDTIMEHTEYDDCPELGKFLQTLKDVHSKIADHDKTNRLKFPSIKNKYNMYEMFFADWKTAWNHNFQSKFINFLGDTSTVEKIIEEVAEFEPTL